MNPSVDAPPRGSGPPATGRSLVFYGKGGAGKTTLACALLEAATAAGWRTLLVDADPQCGAALKRMRQEGWRAAPGASLRALAHQGRHRDTADLAASLAADLIRRPGYDLLAMGRLTGEGCYCGAFAAVAALLPTWVPRYDLTLVDCVAGPEPVSRGILAGAGSRAVLVSSPDPDDLLLAEVVLTTLRARQPAVAVVRVLNRVRGAVGVPPAWATALVVPEGPIRPARATGLLTALLGGR